MGKLTLENEVLERGWQHSLNRSQRNGRPSGYGDVSALPSGPVTEQLKREGDQHGAHRQDQSTCGQLFFLYGYSRDGIARLNAFKDIRSLD